jgi:hypothetical protein
MQNNSNKKQSGRGLGRMDETPAVLRTQTQSSHKSETSADLEAFMVIYDMTYIRKVEE